MPFVSCSATGCVNNCNHQCGLTSLNVCGQNAQKASATCCSSFCDCGCCDNPHPDEFSTVTCNVSSCLHNEHGTCEAGSIDVRGKRAVKPDQTECASFVAR